MRSGYPRMCVYTIEMFYISPTSHTTHKEREISLLELAIEAILGAITSAVLILLMGTVSTYL